MYRCLVVDLLIGGDDSMIIAYDCLIDAGNNWEKLVIMHVYIWVIQILQGQLLGIIWIIIWINGVGVIY
jgi:hypothetical protein